MSANAELIVIRGVIAGLKKDQQTTVGLLADALRAARAEAKANGAEAEFFLAMALVGIEIQGE